MVVDYGAEMTYNIQHLLCDRYFRENSTDKLRLKTDKQDDFFNLAYILCNDFQEQEFEIFTGLGKTSLMVRSMSEKKMLFFIQLDDDNFVKNIYTSTTVQFETEYSKDIYCVSLE
jgi:hypothetical protein